MNRKLPLRTYERRNTAKNTVALYGSSPTATGEKKWPFPPGRTNPFDIDAEAENSFNNDPFDTTFDRLAKNARIPPVPVKDAENSWLSSSDNSSKDEIQGQDDSLVRVSIDLSRLALHTLPAKKVQKACPYKRVLKRKVSKETTFNHKRKKLSSTKHGPSKKAVKPKKTVAGTMLQLEAANNVEEQPLMVNLDISTLSENDFQLKKQDQNSVDLLKVQNSAMNVSVVVTPLNIKPCSVRLQDICKYKEDMNYIQNIDNNMRRNTILYDGTIEQTRNCRSTRLRYKESKITPYYENQVTNCFVKLERLEAVHDTKTRISKAKMDMMCSTPIHGYKNRMVQSLQLSPIQIKFNVKSDTSTDQTHDVSISYCDEGSKPLKLGNTDMRLDKNKGHSQNLKSLETFSSDISIAPESIKSDPAQNIHERLSQIVNQVNSIEEGNSALLPAQRHLEQPNDSKNDVDTISISSESSFSLLRNSKANVKLSFSIQNNENSNSNMFSEIDGTVSLTSANGPNGFVRCDVSGSFVCNDFGKSMQAKTMDSLTLENSPLPLQNKNNNSSKSIFAEKLGIESLKCQNDSKQLQNDKSISLGELSLQKGVENDSFSEARIVLVRLQDPVRVTNRRNQYRKWNPSLSRISSENITSHNMLVTDESMKENERLNVCNKDESHLKNKSVLDRGVQGSYLNSEEPFFLKPGKSWTRSLSILNNIHSGINSDTLFHGKGRKWRHSVKDVLDMQKQGVRESCLNNNESNYCGARETSQFKLDNRHSKIRYTTNLYPVSKRVSIRVVQTEGTRGCTQDSSFLEAYGILSSTNNIPTSAVLRQTLVNIQHSINVQEITQNDSESKARNVVLNKCNQTDYLPFKSHFEESYPGYCKKIGEGVYGEVFLHDHENSKSVIKIIPIEGTECVNGEKQKKFGEILSEIVIAIELHNLRLNSTYSTEGFVEVKSVKCIEGRYPDKLTELWKVYDKEKGSENDCPTMFDNNQLYITLELGHGGQDLEGFIFHTAEEALASFYQATLALAVAEKALQFEHRDLHWGNLLISRTNEKFIQYIFPDKEFNVPSKGVKVSIIDFTLSRMSYEGCCIFNDLALDPALFIAQGDYQFEIYRHMRDTVGNQWQKFEPYTNVLWLHYTLDKMITAVRYKKKTLKIHKNAITKLKSIKNEILNYQSAYDFVFNCDIFANM